MAAFFHLFAGVISSSVKYFSKENENPKGISSFELIVPKRLSICSQEKTHTHIHQAYSKVVQTLK